jgi:hypothetical protein
LIQIKKPISLFDTSAKLDAEITQPEDEDGQAKYSHLPAVEVPKLLQAPRQIPPLFAFSRTSVYLLMSPSTTQKTPKSVVLRGTSTHGPLELEVPVQVLEEPGETIHQLAARKAVGELEEGRGWLLNAEDTNGNNLRKQYPGRLDEIVEREAVRLGVQFQVGGKFCSFVAVEKRVKSKDDHRDHIMSENDYDFLDTDTNTLAEASSIDMIKEDLENLSNKRYVRSCIRNASSWQSGGFPGDGQRSNSGSTRGFRNRTQQPARKSTSGMVPRKQMASKASSNTAQNLVSAAQPTDPNGFDSTDRFSPTNKTSESSDALSQRSRTFGSSASSHGKSGLFRPTSTAAAPPAPSFKSGALTALSAGPMMFSALKRKSAAPASSQKPPSASQSIYPQVDLCAVEMELEESCDDDMGFGLFDEDASVPAPIPVSAAAYQKKAISTSASTPAKSASAFAKDPLHALIELQTFEGFWNWTQELCTALGVVKAAVESKKPGVDEKVLATALAVRYFEAKLAKDKDGWEMIVEKAKTWLEGMGHDEDDTIWELVKSVIT